MKMLVTCVYRPKQNIKHYGEIEGHQLHLNSANLKEKFWKGPNRSKIGASEVKKVTIQR